MKFFKLVENEITNILIDSCFRITRYKILFIELFQFDSLPFNVYKKGEKVVSTVNYSES